uniref:Zinc finger protein 205 n=1 Tax=Trametes gibbosa TaxID=160864 RepID=A0A6B9KCZ0_9APHY|nr:zinc finger protein 205 [Trametes gibbosa]
MREYLAAYEQQNQAALMKYYEERRALEADVERGRLALQRLAQLSGQGAVNVFSPPVAGPSNVALPQPVPRSQAPPLVYNGAEVPTSARIVEVNSPQPDRPPPARGSSGRGGNYYRAHVHQDQNVHVQHHGNVSGDSRIHSWTPGGHTSMGGHTSHYQSAQWDQAAANVQYNRSAHPVQQQASTQHAQSSHTVQAAPITQRSAPPAVYAADTSTHAQAAQLPQTYQQPRYGSNPASYLHGALGTGSGSAPQRVPHAKVPYSSRENQEAAEARQPSNPQLGVLEQQLAAYLKTLSVDTTKQLLAQVMLIIDRKRNGKPRSTMEEVIHNALDARAQQVCEVLVEKYKEKPTAEIQSSFSKLFSIIVNNRQPTQRAASVQHNPSTSAQPVASTSAPQPVAAVTVPPQPTLAALGTASAFSHPTAPNPTPMALGSSSTIVPSTLSASTGPASTIQSSAPRTMTAQEKQGLSWYIPKDPNAPIAYRDHDGQIRYMFRNQQTPNRSRIATGSFSSSAANAPAMGSSVSQIPSVSLQQLGARDLPTVELPGTPELVEIQSESAWTPEKADRTRLARDILRSLGRSHDSLSSPPITKSSSPVTADANAAPAHSKRKSPPSPPQRPSTPLKKARVNVPTEESVSTIPSADVIDLTVSTPEGDATTEPMRTTPDMIAEPSNAFASPQRDGAAELDDRVSVAPSPELPVERETTAASSEAADDNKVQEMFFELPAAESIASGPPSSVKSSSPLQEIPDMVDLPSVDARLFTVDTPEAENALPEPPSPSQRDSAPGRARTASPGRDDKVPLFLPSPSSSLGASSSALGKSLMASHNDGDAQSDTSPAPRSLYGYRNKGKGKGRALSADTYLTSPAGSATRSPSPLPTRPSVVFVEVPPLPKYARQLRESRSASFSTSGSGGDASESDGVDELAEWQDEEDRGDREEGMRAVTQLSYDRMHESPCLWAECHAVLNSMSRLQEHAALHAAENMEWGTYGCRWQNCNSKFTEEAKLAEHLRKHGRTPLYCPYDGCDKSFNTAEALLAHQRSNRHRNGTLRTNTVPFVHVEDVNVSSPLPDVLPAYMSISRRISRHPISKERHQWLGPKVLENITAFKYSGGRSNAALPPRGSRRLAEKVAAAELAGVSPEAALAQIKRWMDDEYLAFADGYNAGRRPGLRCTDVPSQEVSELVRAGLVLWPGEDDRRAAEATGVRARGSGPAGADDDAGLDEDPSDREPEVGPDASTVGDGGRGAADGSEASSVDQLAEGGGPAGRAQAKTGATVTAPVSPTGFGTTEDAAGDVPRRTDVGGPSVPGPARESVAGIPVGTPREDNNAPPRGGVGGAVQAEVEKAHAPAVPWPIWPPPAPPAGRGDEEAVESLG